MAGLISWRIQRLSVTDSTNTVASAEVRALWQSNPAPSSSANGLVIVSERQRAGRGQHGRSWESPAGGLYLSAVVEDVPAAHRATLAIIAGVAAAASLIEATGGAIGLRWPNDLMVAKRKVGGILCESAAQGERWAGIVGVGLNVNTSMDDLPPGLKRTATSLAAQAGRFFDLREIEARLLDSLGATLAVAAREGLDAVIAEARNFDCLRGRWVELLDGEETIQGVGMGFADDGAWLLETRETMVRCSRGTLVAVGGKRLRD